MNRAGRTPLRLALPWLLPALLVAQVPESESARARASVVPETGIDRARASVVPETGIARARASVVLVRTELGGGRTQQGSGVVLAPGLIATNAHVVRNGLGILVLKDGRSWEARELCLASDRDLVLLKVPGLPLPVAPVAAPERLVTGQPVVALGYPGGNGPSATRGSLAALWNYRGDRLLQADAETRPGSSGGGLFTEDGQLLGITTFVFATSQRLNFSVPAAWVLSLLDRPQDPGLVCPLVVGDNLLRDFSELIIDDPANQDQWEALTRTWVLEAPRDAEAWYASGMAVDRRIHEAQPGEGAPLRERNQAVAKVMEAYNHAVSLDSQHAKAWNNLGVAYDDQNRFPEAEAAFRRALSANPGYALAWLNLGNTLVNVGRYQEAVQAYLRGLRLQPDDFLGWARLAFCEGYLKRWRDAAGHYQVALPFAPFRGEWWAEAFKAWTLAGERERAQAALERLDGVEEKLAREMRAWARSRR